MHRKLKYLAGIIIIVLSVYVCFKYLIVYVWPFALGVLIALVMEKPVNVIYEWLVRNVGMVRSTACKTNTKNLNNTNNYNSTKDLNNLNNIKNLYETENIEKVKVNRNTRYTTNAQRKEHRIKSIIATIIISVISIIIIILLIVATITGANEVSSFLKNWNYNTIGIRQQMARICLDADEFLGLECGKCLDTLIMCGRKVTGIMPEKIFHISVPVIKNIVVAAGGIVVSFISVIYLSTGLDNIRVQIKKSVYADEIHMLTAEVKKLINVYFKVELKIMFINMVISMIAFFIVRSQYAVVLGIFVGIVDALPVFGTGTILIPWVLFSVIMKRYFSAGVLLIAYIITYFVREIMESKCMGDKLGISPFMMLVVIFVGLLAYGIPGFITGPVSYVIIKALVKRLNVAVFRT